MDAKLDAFRARKRRQANVDSIKSTLRSMIPFQQQQPPTPAPREHHVNVEEDPASAAATVEPKPPKTASLTRKPPAGLRADDDDVDDVDDTVLPFTDSESDTDAAAAAKRRAAAAAATPPADYLTYLTWLAYFLLWATCWAIAIELQFGLVYLLVSAIAGIYLNTRTGPRRRREVSAYSVFNRDCVAIDGTLNAEQFEREIRYGPAGVR